MLHPWNEHEAKRTWTIVAEVSANLHDIPRELFWLSPGVRLVLIDPEAAQTI